MIDTNTVREDVRVAFRSLPAHFIDDQWIESTTSTPMIDPATGNLATVLPADLPHQAAQQFQSVDGGEARGVAIANDRDKL